MVRVDDFMTGVDPHDCRSCVSVKEIWWTEKEAEAGVRRLNVLTTEKGGGSRYDVEHVRVKRR